MFGLSTVLDYDNPEQVLPASSFTS